MKRKWKITFSVVALILLGITALFISGCSALGTKPSKEDQNRFKASTQYNQEKLIFHNRRKNVVPKMMKSFGVKRIAEFMFMKVENPKPTKKLPDVKPIVQDFLKLSENIKVIWFGHSSFLLNLNGKLILVDPIFSGNASPFFFGVPRFQKPVLELSELPKIDYILLSHDHYDHLDMETMKFFKDKETKLIVPLGVGAHLIGWGIDKSRITELDWWQNIKVEGVEFVATPAQHSSGRGLTDKDATLWASWVIKDYNKTVYFSGDSGYDTHFKAIGDKYGPFDVAFIENGQYNERWHAVHLLPNESVQAYFDLKAKKFFPVHWAMFDLGLHPWYEPIEKLSLAAKEKGINLVTPKMGEIVEIGKGYQGEEWWKNYMN